MPNTLEGLDSATAARRLSEAGPNEIETPRSRNLWAIVRGTLREPMFLLLLVASGLYLTIGDLGEGIFLLCGAGLTIGLVVFQEARSEGALKALRSLAQPYARVFRDGVASSIPARDLAPGDLVLIGEGERIPADGELVAGDVLTIDESLLTGESATVSRAPLGKGMAPEDSLLFAGTLNAGGSGSMRVTQTGPRTRFGKIGLSLSGGADEATPLQKTAGRLVAYLAVAAFGFCIIVFVAYGFVRNDWLQGGLTALTVAISLLPEEFPMVLAIFMALGSWRLARHNVLVRRSVAIEALGGATILCVDKTGTLTLNQMKLVRLFLAGRSIDLEAGGDSEPGAGRLLQTAALASAAKPVDPMDRAIRARVSAAAPPGEPVRTWPLRPGRLAVIQRWERNGEAILAAKGAPETIFQMCRLGPDQVDALQTAIGGMAADGLRVLGVASFKAGPGGELDPDQHVFDFLGLIGFIDPLRPDVPGALKEAGEASIAVAMITGDHPSTALAIARQAGIDTAAGVATGADIAGLNETTLRERVKRVRVFARIAPEQKLQLVQALRANGEVVVMTGDGVNDGPALQASHIGIAMGRRGTDVAREAADIVLLDDSFPSIVGGVRLGRRIFTNLRKALIFITAVHVPIAGLALIPILLGMPPLFYPMHVILLELIIDPVCSLVFESEPSEAGAMKRPPRRSTEMLFGWKQGAVAVLQGVVVLAVIAGFFAWALSVAPENEARGAAFASLVLANLALALSDASGGRGGLLDRSHTIFWLITAIAATVVAAGLYIPPLAGILQFAPPDISVLAPGLVLAAIAGGWFGVARMLRRQTQRPV